MITLHGMMEYDKDLFTDVVLPQDLDKDVLVNKLDWSCGDMYCYYQIPSRFKERMVQWFNIEMYPNFKKMTDVLNAEYNPIHNYDRNEEWIDNNKTTNDLDSTTTVNSHGNTTNDVSAYDSATYSPQDYSESEEHGGTTIDSLSTIQSNGGHKGHLYGNIGVTTTQQMIEAELNLRKMNIYDEIVKMFEKTFMIQVY